MTASDADVLQRQADSASLLALREVVAEQERFSPATWGLVGTRTRTRRLAPFAALCLLVLPLTLLLPPTPDRGAWLIAATVVMVTAGLQIVVVPWHHLPAVWRHVPSITFCIGVVLLRQAGGDTAAGYGSILVLLPVTWQAIYGRRIDLALALATVTAALMLPPALLDGYADRSELPRVLLTITITAAVGVVFRSLSDALRANDRSLRVLVAVSRALATADDPRTTLCDGFQILTDADHVTLFESTPVGLRPTVSAHAPGALATRITDSSATSQEAALAQAEPSFEKTADRGLQLHVPIGPHHAPVAVITARWSDARRAPNRRALNALTLIGIDAGHALEQADLITALDDQANRDLMTGLPNRRAWDQLLERELAVAHRHQRPLSVAIIDLDHFKAYNDEHGHLRGDELLRDATEAWSGALRDGDVLARWGGEEFVVLFPRTVAAATIPAIERLRAVTPGDQTFSAGVSQLRRDDTPDSLMSAADVAMYQAKAAGRDQILIARRDLAPTNDQPSTARQQKLSQPTTSPPTQPAPGGR